MYVCMCMCMYHTYIYIYICMILVGQAPRMAVAPHNMVFVDAAGVPEAGQNQAHNYIVWI